MDKKTDLPSITLQKRPTIDESVFIANGAQIIGDVTILKNASIWYNAVIRGDINAIKIGTYTNIQDGCIIHVENERQTVIGDYVTIGHNAIIHGCTIENGTLIGMGASVLNGAQIGKGCIIGANALVTENQIIPPYSLVIGLPGKIKKELTQSTFDENIRWAEKYAKLAIKHRALS